MKPDIQTITSTILDEGYFAALPTIGPSMYPVIRAGDKIYVESLKGKKPGKGDIILFKSGENMVCHRLVRIFERNGTTYYQTRGDAFFHKDTSITYEQIIGRVVRIDRPSMSWTRKILLLSPFLRRVTILNAVIVNALVWIKKIAVYLYISSSDTREII